MKTRLIAAAFGALALLEGCADTHPPAEANTQAQLTPVTQITHDLLKLPAPKGTR